MGKGPKAVPIWHSPWRFVDKDTDRVLYRIGYTRSQWRVLSQDNASPDNPDLKDYFERYYSRTCSRHFLLL